MRRKFKPIISRTLSMVLAASMLLQTGVALPVRAQEGEQPVYSAAGTMEIVSRRVTKADLYDAVPQEQKTANEGNSVAVQNEVLSVDLNDAAVIDYVRFAGDQNVPAERRVGTGSEDITIEYTATELAAVEDWTNLQITSREAVNTTTATNFRGEGAQVVFKVPTHEGEERVLTIYAGGHPDNGTYSAQAYIGEETLKTVWGNQEAESYSFTPASSQVTEYKIAYQGTGEELKVVLDMRDTSGTHWAGISVAAAVLRAVETQEPEIPQEPAVQENTVMKITKKVASKSSLYADISTEQKTVTQDNPVAVQDEVMVVDLTAQEVVDYLRFNGEESPLGKEQTGAERMEFRAAHVGLEAVSDWTNLKIHYGNEKDTTTATVYRGEGAQVELLVPTVAGQKRTLEVYAGGHPAGGTYCARAKLGETPITVKAGDVQLQEYTYTPGSSQIVVYELEYVGTGETLAFTISLENTGEVSWAGIGLAAAVLRKEGTEMPSQPQDPQADPRPYVKDTTTLSSQNLGDWKLWYNDEFDNPDGTLDDWWEPSYLKWWNYSSESNEKYNVIEEDTAAIDDNRGVDGKVLKQFVTPTMRADSIVTRSDNFRNPGITLGVRDLNHNYGRQNLMNYQHMPTDDRGATAYGYFEIRAKITGGSTANTVSGSTAWWFTGFQDASWQTQEVDMVEYGYGVGVNSLNGHFASPNHPWRDPFAGSQPRSWDSAKFGVAKPADDYHVYGIEWTPTGMKGYFDGEQVWSKSINVNYRMLTWLSLNAHAKDTYITDSKEHKIDYIRIWKTDALEQLEKEMVTRNVVQKLQPVNGNVATLAYAGANGISSSHYQTWDPNFFNDGDENTSFKVMTPKERKTTARTAYNSEQYYLYLDWVKYNAQEIQEAQNLTEAEIITGSDGRQYTLASPYDIRRAKTVEAVELVVNKKAGYKSIDKANSNNAKADFAYKLTSLDAHLFPYTFDVEYSENGVDQWLPIATDITANWQFGDSQVASYIVNVPRTEKVNHLRLHVKSVWDSNANKEVGVENGFYLAEIKVYEEAKENAASAQRGNYQYNHALDAVVNVTDKDNHKGSEDMNFPVADVADGVYVNEFRSSGDSRTDSSTNRVDVNVPVTVLEEGQPQYLNFTWDSARTIDNFSMTIGYISSAPTEFALEYFEGGEWKEINYYHKADWNKDFETFVDDSFTPVVTKQMRVKVIAANKGLKVDRADGVQTGYGIRVCIAPGYYSIAEIELNETK